MSVTFSTKITNVFRLNSVKKSDLKFLIYTPASAQHFNSYNSVFIKINQTDL